MTAQYYATRWVRDRLTHRTPSLTTSSHIQDASRHDRCQDHLGVLKSLYEHTPNTISCQMARSWERPEQKRRIEFTWEPVAADTWLSRYEQSAAVQSISVFLDTPIMRTWMYEWQNISKNVDATNLFNHPRRKGAIASEPNIARCFCWLNLILSYKDFLHRYLSTSLSTRLNLHIQEGALHLWIVLWFGLAPV